MSVDQFRDDDQGYLAWTAAHPGGYVINVQRSLNPGDARLHRADCYTINGRPARGGTWTGPYIKICSASARNFKTGHTRISTGQYRAAAPATRSANRSAAE